MYKKIQIKPGIKANLFHFAEEYLNEVKILFICKKKNRSR